MSHLYYCNSLLTGSPWLYIWSLWVHPHKQSPQWFFLNIWWILLLYTPQWHLWMQNPRMVHHKDPIGLTFWSSVTSFLALVLFAHNLPPPPPPHTDLLAILFLLWGLWVDFFLHLYHCSSRHPPKSHPSLLTVCASYQLFVTSKLIFFSCLWQGIEAL